MFVFFLHRLTPLHEWQVLIDPPAGHTIFRPEGEIRDLPDCQWYSQAQAEADRLNEKQDGGQEALPL